MRKLCELIPSSKSTVPQSFVLFPYLLTTHTVLLYTHYEISPCTLPVQQVQLKTHSLWDVLDHQIPSDFLLNLLVVKLLFVSSIWPFYSKKQKCWNNCVFRIQNFFIGYYCGLCNIPNGVCGSKHPAVKHISYLWWNKFI